MKKSQKVWIVFLVLLLLFLLLAVKLRFNGNKTDSKKDANLLENEIESNYHKANDQDLEKNHWFKPVAGISWYWQLSGMIDTTNSVDVYDVDLFETDTKIIEYLHKKGVKVICYFNAGAYEPYRPDSKLFNKSVLGNTLEGWEDERWLDIVHYDKFADIMLARLDLAKSKNCDGVEPDNVDAYLENSGFELTFEDQLKYNRWLAIEAHKRNLAIGLKNDLDQVKDLVGDFDFAVNEQCFEYDECDKLKPFIQKDKAVFHVEYNLDLDDFCLKSRQLHFSSIKADIDLDGNNVKWCK